MNKLTKQIAQKIATQERLALVRVGERMERKQKKRTAALAEDAERIAIRNRVWKARKEASRH